MKREDLFLAENLIASKRLQLDEKVSKVKGVQFFFSAVGGVITNPTKQSKKQQKTLTKNEETNEKKIRQWRRLIKLKAQMKMAAWRIRRKK